MPKLLIALVLVVPGVAYACGWRRLSAAGHPPPWWRPVLYLSGLLTVAAALVSPLDELADKRFSVHMIQHMLLTMVAAPLLLLGNPLAVLLWGVPGRLRRTLARPLARGSRVRRVLAT